MFPVCGISYLYLKLKLKCFFYIFYLSRKFRSINMNITIAANLELFNLSTPGQLEKEPGQGLIVFLYDYFYVG